jgi:hypothetical protein
LCRGPLIAAADRASWPDAKEQRFRDNVRHLARTHDLRGRTGDASVLFDPPDTGIDDWLTLGDTGPVEEIAAELVPTLSTDAFYDLW